MPRVKRGVNHIKKRKKLLSKVKGFSFGRKKLIKEAKVAALKAGRNAYNDRKRKKRINRGLNNIRINAFVRDFGFSYSKFIGLLKEKKIELNRVILAKLAAENKDVLAKVIDELK